MKDWTYDEDDELNERQISKLVNQMFMDADIESESVGSQNSDESVVRQKQKKSLLELLDTVMAYMAHSNRMELDECQWAAREIAMALMRIQDGEKLDAAEMQKFEDMYDEFKL